MLSSHQYGRLTPDESADDYSFLIRELHKRFKAQFGTIYCRDIMREEAAKKADPICMDTYDIGARIVTGLLFDAPDLLAERAALKRKKKED